MASVNINYINESALPTNLRHQVEVLSQHSIGPGSKLCLALFQHQLLGVICFRTSGAYGRIDFLSIDPSHHSTKLGQILLQHCLKQLHELRVREVNTAMPAELLNTFLKFGFIEETIVVPSMVAPEQHIELVHPNLDNLKSYFKQMVDSSMEPKDKQPSEDKDEKRLIQFDTLTQYKELAHTILANAQRHIYIMCHNLDDPALSDKDMIAHIRNALLHNRKLEVRILLEDDRYPKSKHSPALELAQRLSTFVSIRHVEDPHYAPKEWLYLCDDKYAIERRREQRFIGKAYLDNPAMLQRFTYEFENFWQHAVPSSSLRRISI